jgi:hypothetical protein
VTPDELDSQYYRNVLKHRVLFASDVVLLETAEAARMVRQSAKASGRWEQKFGEAMAGACRGAAAGASGKGPRSSSGAAAGVCQVAAVGAPQGAAAGACTGAPAGASGAGGLPVRGGEISGRLELRALIGVCSALELMPKICRFG